MSQFLAHVRRGFGENVRFAMLAVRAHKLRATLTILGIVVGVATVIAMVSIVTGFNNNMVRSFQSFGASLVMFQKYEPRFGQGGHRPEGEQAHRDLTLEDAAALKAGIPEMRAVSPQRYLWDNTDYHLKYRDNEAKSPRVFGVVPDYAIATSRFVAQGRFFTEIDVDHASDVIVIGEDIRQKLFPNEDPINKRVLLGHDAYTIVGVFERKGKMFGDSQDNFVTIPLTTFDRRFPWIKVGGADGDALRIATVPYNPDQVPILIDKARTILRARRHVRFDQPDDFGIVTPDKMIESFQGITRGVTLAMIFIAFISLLIGGVGVMNIMLVSVTERTREIGVRKAVGAFRRDIVMQFLTEATALSLLGGAIGVVVGMAVPAAIKKAFDALPAETPLWSVIVGLVVSISVGIFFGLYPAVKASRLDPIEALRYE
jgi:putative ABC transport system permease protein